MISPTLSVCICHKNRSYYEWEGRLVPLFRNSYDRLLSSICLAKVDAEIVIADWLDDTRLGLGPWCDDHRVRVVRCVGDFTRGGGRRHAAAAARGEVLFFMDADMLVPPALLTRGIEVARQRDGFFPFYKRQPKPGLGPNMNDGIGTGNVFCLREIYKDTSGFPEKKTWGGEDTAFWIWFVKRNISVREHVDGFIHQWHPGEGPDKGNKSGA